MPSALQALASRIKYPAPFNRKYRCVVEYSESYIMEEYANMVWIGSLIAKIGPPGFQSLWRLLRPVLKHYIYNFDAEPEECELAGKQLWDYACCVEEHVQAGHVRRRGL